MAALRDARGRFVRTDARGSLVSGASIVSVRLVGMEDVERALRELARLGDWMGEAIVGTDLVDPPYPFFLEFGTSRMPAYPSARPAFDEMRDTAVRTFGDVAGQMIAGGQRDPSVVYRASLTEGARPIENRWKELARYRTGTYRRSIHTEIVEGIRL